MINDKWTSETAPKGKGRGPKRFCFTYEDIARATGNRIDNVRRHFVRGKFKSGDLVSLARYIIKYLK